MLNYEFPPLGGGAGHCTYYLAETLAEKGVEVDVLTSRYGKLSRDCRYSKIRLFQVPVLRKGIHNCGLRGALSYLFLASLKIRSLVRQNRYDLIHCFFYVPTGLLLFFLKDFKDIPTIVSLRGSDVPHYDPFDFKTRIIHNGLRPFALEIIRSAAKVVANSNFLGNLAIKHLKRQDILVIPNAVDTAFFSPNSRPETNNDSKRLLCVSRLIPRKGIEDLIKAMVNFKNTTVCLDIIGSGKSEENLKKIIKENNLSDLVKLHGFIPQENLPSHYHSADIFVLPSLTESGGEAFLEAMSCGLPIVSNRVGGIPEYVSNGHNGLLVAPGDVNGLYMAMKTLVEKDQLRKSMGQNSRNIIKARHSWGSITEQYLKVYQESIGFGSAKRSVEVSIGAAG
jgi:glycosyltransferase involved in cell wall biosynthesis